MATAIKNNRLIKKTILKSYLPSFLVALVFNLNWLVDILLASCLVANDVNFFTSASIGENAYSVVAAIGIAYPITALLTAVLLAFVQGTSIKYNDALARGYKGECSKIFSQGVWTVILLGISLSVINYFLADFIVRPFGANDNILVYFASLYLKLSGFGFTFAALNRLYINTLGVYGRNGSILIGNILDIVLNISLSILFYYLLGKVEMPFLFTYGAPEGYKLTLGIGALALGTFAAELITFIFFAIIKYRYRIEAKLTFVKPSWSAFATQFTKGFPVIASIFIESLIAGLINIIVVYANCWDSTTISGTQALIVYSVVRSFWQLSQVPSQAMGLATIPMIGLFYGAKDKDAVKDSWKNGVVAGMLFTLAWAVTLLLISPLIMNAYKAGTGGLVTYIEQGILCVLPCSAFFTFIFMLQTFYAVINRPVPSILVSTIPEAIIFPITLVICLNSFKCGNNNLFFIWGTMGLNVVLFFLIAYIGNAIKNKQFKIDLDRMLQIDKGEQQKLPLFDVSVNTLDEISQLAETIQKFFKENEVSDRTSMFAALAVDEIANDILKKGDIKIKSLPENVSYLDIKIMSEQRHVKIIIRDAGSIYNPLSYDVLVDNVAKVGVKAVQKMASYINYQRVYKMNIVTIEIEK